MKPTTKLKELIHRTDRVLVVMHTPSAALARTMEAAGAEVGFVGTQGVVGAYTGLADVGTATLTECVMIAGWIARSVTMPILMDGDTGHGGIMAVRRTVAECIRAGIAGVRLDDQPIEGKRATQHAGLEVVPLDLAIARYRAAVDMRDELDPDFVIMAQCYARDAANGGLEECLRRLRAYEQDAGVDWVQFESPHSLDEIRQARAVVSGPLSFMRGKLPQDVSLEEHRALGVTIAWYPGFTHHVINVALWEFMKDFQARGLAAWHDFQRAHPDVPPRFEPDEGPTKQRALEERYYSRERLAKYTAPSHGASRPSEADQKAQPGQTACA